MDWIQCNFQWNSFLSNLVFVVKEPKFLIYLVARRYLVVLKSVLAQNFGNCQHARQFYAGCMRGDIIAKEPPKWNSSVLYIVIFRSHFTVSEMMSTLLSLKEPTNCHYVTGRRRPFVFCIWFMLFWKKQNCIVKKERKQSKNKSPRNLAHWRNSLHCL